MSAKGMVWVGAFAGSALGGWLPSLWHAPFWSMWGLLFSTAGGLAGIWAGWKLGQGL